MNRLKVRDARDGVDATLIVDEDGRIIAMCRQRDEAIDLAAAWNARPIKTQSQIAEEAIRLANAPKPTERTPQQEQELDVMRSRAEL